MSNSDYTIYPAGGFAPMALLAAPVSQLDTTLTFTKLNEPYPNSITVGFAILVDEEIMMISSWGAAGTMEVRRGCADTIPATHGAGAKIWFIDDETQSDQNEYVGGQEIGVKVLPYIPAGKRLAVEAAEAVPLTFNWRFTRPYPPAQMLVNGARWYVQMPLNSDEPTLALSWVDRNRVTQADQLVGHEEANVAPEPGTTYTMRVFDHTNTLVRTEPGISGHAFSYTWQQALNDFGVGTDPEGQTFNGRLEFESARDGFASWQFYVMPFALNNLAAFLFVAQAGQQIAQPSDEAMPQRALHVGQAGQQIVQPGDEVNPQIMLAAQVSESAGQATSFNTPLTRKLYEAAYTHMLRRGLDPFTNRVMTATARPSDRLTDTHKVYGRGDPTHQFAQRDTPAFTPWLMLDEDVTPLQVVVAYEKTSLQDGIPISGVQLGQLALLGDEVVRVDAINATHITLGRGCVDTVPAMHMKDTLVWFIGAAGGFDGPANSYNEGTTVEDKIVPDVYGPPLDLAVVPADTTKIKRRSHRPFPPGFMRVNGLPWFVGATARPESDITLTWVQRNRITQTDAVIAHEAPNIPHEEDTLYRISIVVYVRSTEGKQVPVIVRDQLVDGNIFVYSYAMAQADGGRVARLLDVCGYVTVPLYVDAVREGYTNWQGYAIPLTLPAPACPINKPPGGGQGPNNPTVPGGGDSGGGSGGSGGTGGPGTPPVPPIPPVPPYWPPIPPNPPKPGDPGEPDPGDTDPDPGDTGEHWDYTWDIHWDAYRRVGDDDIGEGR